MMRILKRTAVGVALTAALLELAACAEPTTRDADRQALLDIYEAQRQAHFEGDARKFFAAVDTGYWSVSNGQARFVRKDDAVASSAGYFQATTFDEVSDVSPPRITFSDDGRTAWLIGQVQVRASQGDSTGAERPFSLRAAWVDLYRKGPSGWHLEVRANTERVTPEQPEE